MSATRRLSLATVAIGPGPFTAALRLQVAFMGVILGLETLRSDRGHQLQLATSDAFGQCASARAKDSEWIDPRFPTALQRT
jgi:hypothetical protein